jgi:DNA-binding NarL/FixJ family response regulator
VESTPGRRMSSRLRGRRSVRLLRGIATLPAIHAIAPTARVIMVSGTNDDTVPRCALAHSALDYVVKPVDLNRITEIVDLALLF